jgi:hypothetical protein
VLDLCPLTSIVKFSPTSVSIGQEVVEHVDGDECRAERRRLREVDLARDRRGRDLHRSLVAELVLRYVQRLVHALPPTEVNRFGATSV